MTSSASTVIPHRCAMVATRLAAVPSWAPALADVAWALPVGFERYRFGLQHGRSVEEVLVAVRWDARNRRLAWRSFDGPTWTGQLKLHDLDGIRTRVQLDVLALPRTGFEVVSELFGAGSRDLVTELAAVLDAAVLDAAVLDAAVLDAAVLDAAVDGTLVGDAVVAVPGVAPEARSAAPQAPVTATVPVGAAPSGSVPIGSVPIGRTVLPQSRRSRGDLVSQN